jgi:hypothetical protein
MLRRISTAVASAAVLGVCVLPATANASTHHARSGSFTIPSASSDVKAWGSWSTFSSSLIKVQVCIKASNSSYDVGAEARGYNSGGKTSLANEIGAVYLQGASSHQACGTRYIRYLAHLKVYSFYAKNGKIIKTSKTKTIW